MHRGEIYSLPELKHYASSRFMEELNRVPVDKIAAVVPEPLEQQREEDSGEQQKEEDSAEQHKPCSAKQAW